MSTRIRVNVSGELIARAKRQAEAARFLRLEQQQLRAAGAQIAVATAQKRQAPSGGRSFWQSQGRRGRGAAEEPATPPVTIDGFVAIIKALDVQAGQDYDVFYSQQKVGRIIGAAGTGDEVVWLLFWSPLNIASEADRDTLQPKFERIDRQIREEIYRINTGQEPSPSNPLAYSLDYKYLPSAEPYDYNLYSYTLLQPDKPRNGQRRTVELINTDEYTGMGGAKDYVYILYGQVDRWIANTGITAAIGEGEDYTQEITWRPQ